MTNTTSHGFIRPAGAALFDRHPLHYWTAIHNQLMALVDALETQLAASHATAANLLSALVTDLPGTPSRPTAN